MTKTFWFSGSYTAAILSRLFGSSEGLRLSDTRFGKIFSQIENAKLAYIFFLSSVGLFWYEGFLVARGGAFINQIYLPSILLVLSFVFSDKSKVVLDRAMKYLMLFLLSLCASGALAAYKGIDLKIIILGLLLYLQFFLAIFCGLAIKDKFLYFKGLVILSVPMLTAGIYQFISKQKTSPLWVSSTETAISTRAFGFFTGPNIFGGVVMLVFFIAAYLYFAKKDYLALFVAIASIIALGFSYSRSSWIAVVVAVAVVGVIYQIKTLLLTPLLALPLLVQSIRQRISIIFTGSYLVDASIDGRIWAINNGLFLLSKYPIFGTGPGTYGGQLALANSSPVYLEGIQRGFVALYFTDNQWLQILVQAGLVGTILLLLFFGSLFYRWVVEYYKTRDIFFLLAIGTFVSFIIFGAFGNVLEFSAIAIPTGLIMGSALSES